MSLISEALKKARQEAAKQEAVQRGVPYAIGSVEPASRRGLLAPLAAGLGAGAVLVGALVLAAFLGHWGPWKGRAEPPAATVQPQQVAQALPFGAPAGTSSASGAPGGVAANPDAGAPGMTAPPTSVQVPRDDQLSPLPPGTLPASTSPPAGVPAGAGPPAQEPPAASAAQRVPTPPPPAAPPPPTASATPAATPSTPPATASVRPAAPAPEETEEKVYTGELPVPGGGTLHLNGVAFSESPVAVIDGKVMSQGEIVQGFTIVEIQRGRVRLQGHGMSVVLAVR